MIREIQDMPKLHSPFIRKLINNRYLVTPDIDPDYSWVFDDDSVLAIEKLNGTNVSILIEDGIIRGIWNRKNRIPFFNTTHSFIVQGLLNSYNKGYIQMLPDGQHFGELIGPKLNCNLYNLPEHLWIPFNTYARNHLRYKSWGKYPKDYDTISTWFKELMPLFNLRKGNRDGFVEGIVFTHPDGRMSKLRCDMFDWYHSKNEVK